MTKIQKEINFEVYFSFLLHRGNKRVNRVVMDVLLLSSNVVCMRRFIFVFVSSFLFLFCFFHFHSHVAFLCRLRVSRNKIGTEEALHGKKTKMKRNKEYQTYLFSKS